MAEEDLRLTVTRSSAKKMASKIFGYSVAALISLAYINMGCALDLEVLKTVLRRPVGPAIGFVAQVIQHRDALRSHIVWGSCSPALLRRCFLLFFCSISSSSLCRSSHMVWGSCSPALPRRCDSGSLSQVQIGNPYLKKLTPVPLERKLSNFFYIYLKSRFMF